MHRRDAQRFPWQTAILNGGVSAGLWVGFIGDVLSGLPSPCGHLILLGCTLVGAGMGGAVGSLVRAWGWRQVMRHRKAEWLQTRQCERTQIATAPEGWVEISGKVRTIRPVMSLIERRSCAAFTAHVPAQIVAEQEAPDDSSYYESCGAVGEIEIDDGSGSVAVIPAGPCDLLLGPHSTYGEHRLEDGVVVVIRGKARWKPTTDTVGSYRSCGRVLEVSGDSSGPVLIDVC